VLGLGSGHGSVMVRDTSKVMSWLMVWVMVQAWIDMGGSRVS